MKLLKFYDRIFLRNRRFVTFYFQETLDRDPINVRKLGPVTGSKLSLQGYLGLMNQHILLNHSALIDENVHDDGEESSSTDDDDEESADDDCGGSAKGNNRVD